MSAGIQQVPEVQEKRFGNKSANERSIQGECRDEKDGQLVICEPEESQHANGDTIADTASDEDDEGKILISVKFTVVKYTDSFKTRENGRVTFHTLCSKPIL